MGEPYQSYGKRQARRLRGVTLREPPAAERPVDDAEQGQGGRNMNQHVDQVIAPRL